MVTILFSPLIIFRGFVASGQLSLLNSNISVANGVFILRPLENIEFIAGVILILSILTMAIIVILLLSTLRLRREEYLGKLVISSGYVYGAHAFSIMLLVLMMSLMRLVSRDLVPTIPFSYSTETSAGRLYLYPSEAIYSSLYLFYLRQGGFLWIYVFAQVILLITAILVTAYLLDRVDREIIEKKVGDNEE